MFDFNFFLDVSVAILHGFINSTFGCRLLTNPTCVTPPHGYDTDRQNRRTRNPNISIIFLERQICARRKNWLWLQRKKQVYVLTDKSPDAGYGLTRIT